MAILCWILVGLAILRYTTAREKPERSHAAILPETLFLDRTAALDPFSSWRKLDGQIHDPNRPFIIVLKSGSGRQRKNRSS